jgi:hypothetical protein
LWFRGFAEWTDKEGVGPIAALAAAFHTKRFVVGHTPQTGGIQSRFDGTVVLIDTGMLSTYFKDGRSSALNIQDGRVSFIY